MFFSSDCGGLVRDGTKKWSFEEVKKCGFLVEIEEDKFIISFELDLFQETDAGHLMTSFIKGQCQYSTSLMKEVIFQSGSTVASPSIPAVEEGSFEDLFEMNLFDKNLKEFKTATIGEPVVVQGPVLYEILLVSYMTKGMGKTIVNRIKFQSSVQTHFLSFTLRSVQYSHKILRAYHFH